MLIRWLLTPMLRLLFLYQSNVLGTVFTIFSIARNVHGVFVDVVHALVVNGVCVWVSAVASQNIVVVKGVLLI